MVVGFLIMTLRQDSHAVFHAFDGLSATELAFSLDECHSRHCQHQVDGLPEIELIRMLRTHLPSLPII